MKITSRSQAIHVDKPEGSSVDYYLFPEYEVHHNRIQPGTVQAWHHHTQISEVIYVAAGQIEVQWLDQNDQKQLQVAKPGDVIDVQTTPHTFVNNSDQPVELVVFRFVPTGIDQSEVIKNDKILDSHLD